jgi:two-component system sensor kinase FixL
MRQSTWLEGKLDARLDKGMHPFEDTEECYRSLFYATGAGIVIVGLDRKIVDANPAYCHLLGYSKDEILGKAIIDFTHPEDQAESRRLFRELREAKRTGVDLEKRYVRKDGSTVWVHLAGQWRLDDDSKPLQGVAVVQDITKQKEAEQALRQSRDRLESIVGTASDAIVTIDGKGIIDSFNPAAERMFGYTKEEAVGSNVSILMPSPHRDEHDRYLAHYLETGDRRMIGIGREMKGRRRDGSSFPVELSVSEVNDLDLFTGIIRDISERKHSEAALEQSEERLRALSSSLLTAQEEERRYLASELHDALGHRLALLGMEVDRLGHADDVAKVKMKDLVEEVAEHIRNLSHRLHPSGVEHLGLIVALRRECETMAEATARNIEFRADNHVPRRPPLSLAMCLYRVAQEALRNAATHSGSKKIAVSLGKFGEGIRLSVEDWGKGFTTAGRGSKWGLGLLSMKERAHLVGGKLEVESTPGRGTIVRCWAPLPEQESSVEQAEKPHGQDERNDETS